MSVYGNSPFGHYGYGGSFVDYSSLTQDVPSVAGVNQIAADVVEVVFNTYVVNNAILQDPAKYTIEPLSTGDGVRVVGVQAGRAIAVSSLFLYVSKATLAEYYKVTVPPQITSLFNDTIAENQGVWKTRTTKTDYLLSKFSPTYNKSPHSRIRKLLTAISLADDQIGGTLKNYKELVR